jgi:PAS domain S-box-containing protein
MRAYWRQRGTAYLIAVAVTAAALLVRWFVVGGILGPDAPLYLFLFAVMAAAWYGGLKPGLLTTVLTALLGIWFFIARDDWSVIHPVDRVRIGMFLAAGVGVSWFAEAMHRSLARADERWELLRVTLESVGDAVVTTDAAGRLTLLNPVAVALTGWTNDDAAGRPLEEVVRVVNEQTREPVANPARRVLAEGKIIELANHPLLVARDGATRPIDDSAAPIRDREGRIRGVVLIFRDVTERRRAERALRESEARLAADLRAMTRLYDLGTRLLTCESLYAGLDDVLEGAIEASGADFGNVQLYNPRIAALEIVAQRGFHQEFLDYFRTVRVEEGSACAQAMQSGARIIIEDVELDPTFEPHRRIAAAAGFRGVQSTPLKSRSGSVLGMLSTHFRRPHRPSERDQRFLDLYACLAAEYLERVRTQEALQKQAARLRLLWEAAGVLLTTDDADAMLRGLFDRIGLHLGLDCYFNYVMDDAGEALRLASCAGIPEATARSISRLEFGQAICGTVAVERRPIVATRIQQSDDPNAQLVKGFGIRAYACNPLLAGEHLLGTLSFASRSRDQFDADELEFLETVSRTVAAAYERLRLLHQLREMDRRKDEFLATLAHELRNLLAPVRNSLHVLRLAAGDKAMAEQARAVMERQLHQFIHLIDDLMDVGRIARNKLKLRTERIDLVGIVRNALEISRSLIEAAGHELTVSLPSEPIHVQADETRLAQVFSNLLNNAAKYTERGGHIWLTVRREGSDAVVAVKDTGVGISADQLPHIFDLFAQVDRSLEHSQGGLGIGLSVVRRLVELHGGRVEVHSDGHDKGSEFVVRLPLVNGPATDRPATEGQCQTTDAAGHCKVLVVDDNDDTATSLQMMLEMLGHDVRTAHDGPQALEVARAYQPDLVLLDIGLPKLNGHEVARRIREQPWGKDMKLVAMTGWGQDEDLRRSKEAGFDHHLVKPVEPAVLEDLLTRLCPAPA